ncbi:hypothetical protein [Spirosoma montaniterrae]|uniref:Uncharacterized protein n=1 Tax=Spirosoma montaniterrae TaxID=1178516 RepID=A0A1P9WW93_9BACT|nr:hypothetical protein [Spirosoma montaniterrae]AQG79644.1 hypothetical protein AWR27_10075 [Spirosoma montaniterrae]
MVAPPKLTNLQIELLQTFAYPLADEQLTEIRQLLAQYFLNKADAEMEKLCQENGWNEDTIESWAKGHGWC